ncbi:MAG: ABC transporter permease subunit [Methylococcaceae bacterium]
MSLRTNPSISNLSSAQYQKWRRIKDTIANYSVAAGGLGVIGAILLIFIYLLYVVFPLFLPASIEALTHYNSPKPALGSTLYLNLEEQNEIATRITDQGYFIFFRTEDGKIVQTEQLKLPKNVSISSFASGSKSSGTFAFGLSDGSIMVGTLRFESSYPNDQRVITPSIHYPLGERATKIDPDGQPIKALTVQSEKNKTTVVAKASSNKLLINRFAKKDSLFDDELELQKTTSVLDYSAEGINFLLLDKTQNKLYLATKEGRLSFFNIRHIDKPKLIQHLNIIKAGLSLSSLTFLNADLSILAGDSSGYLSQWSVVRDRNNRKAIKMLRGFQVSDNPVLAIETEQRRKGFAALDSTGQFKVYHPTSERELIAEQIDNSSHFMALSPRANHLLIEDQQGEMQFWKINNKHPEVSWKSLWKKIWYEGYRKPDYVWQSSSASNDFEPKFSLTPLVFGTIKAAFYAMLLAVPLAIMGAIYTAYFMAPGLRRIVKPSIEIMGALPTVILGFIAGLWLAPFVEDNLTGIFAILLLNPLAVVLFSFLWDKADQKWKFELPEGWDFVFLIPVLLLASWFALAISPIIDSTVFNDTLQSWLNDQFGISYDQRNSIIVGLAMGFAVIPTIFTIAEDAIFSVPKHLTFGSLALGATTWQTMVKVVLLTASPGIFSGVMIGFGRAVGETMVVLMATGNTPVMDLSIFEGMRTLSANIAVEMPESEVDSTHYRILFLAALVLFLFTFVFNTFAEIIRQRLREKYSSL